MPTTTGPAELSTVLLDVDGTLLDSNDAHARAWVETFAEFGSVIPFQRVRELIGKGGDKMLRETMGVDEDSARGKAIAERRRSVFQQGHLPTLRPFPGARELLQAMRSRGLDLVVATSARGDELQGLLRAAQVDDLVPQAITSSDASHSKPDPDIVEAALERAGCSADQAILLGDTPYDVEAAGRAGVSVVALRCGGWDDYALRGALSLYDDPEDLLHRFDDSPFALAAARGPRRPEGGPR